MKRFRRGFVTLLVLVSVFATSVFAAPSVNELERKKKNAEAEMKSLQEDLAETMTAINKMEMQLVSKGEEVIEATEQLEKAQLQEEQQYENMVKRIVTMYESGNSSALQLIFESGSIAQMLQNIDNVHSCKSM